jgi:hypothetical protein
LCARVDIDLSTPTNLVRRSTRSGESPTLLTDPRVVSREVVEFGFAVFGVAVMTETAIV